VILTRQDMSTRKLVSVDRLAETEYVSVADPAYVRKTPHGRFVCDPRFPDRHDGNQLFDCRWLEGEVEDFIAFVEDLYAGTGLGFRKISGHDEVTVSRLKTPLEERGWRYQKTWMMTFDQKPRRPVNPEVRVEVVDCQTNPHLEKIHAERGRSEGGFRYMRAQEPRLGGETLIAWLDGEPVGMTGWFVVNGVARFRNVGTVERARGRRVATTLIRYVQDHPIVREQDALTIHCAEDGPLPLYESLGFRKQGFMWGFLRILH
jgi:GNAT superfamily N-acetyltransferase